MFLRAFSVVVLLYQQIIVDHTSNASAALMLSILVCFSSALPVISQGRLCSNIFHLLSTRQDRDQLTVSHIYVFLYATHNM